MRKKTERALMPMKVREKLTLGVAGTSEVVWLRSGAKVTTKIAKAPSTLPGFSVNGATIRLPLVEGTPEQLKKAIDGKTAITLDLRNNVNGDYGIMRQVLGVLAPSGKYGSLTNERK